MTKVVIFDFDGVIVNSCQFSYGINREMIPGLEYSEWQSWFDGNFYECARPELVNDATQIDFFERYGEKIKNMPPIENMPKIIEELAKNYTLVIVSSSSEKVVNSYLKKYKLANYFNEVLGWETHCSKVEKIKSIIEKYKINTDDTLIITDTLGDILEAKEAGIKAIAVSWGVHSKEKLFLGSPYKIIDELFEIIPTIKTALL